MRKTNVLESACCISHEITTKLLNGSSGLRPLSSMAGSEPYRMSDSCCSRQRARSALFTLSESLFEDAPTHAISSVDGPAVRPTCMQSPQ